ncbi:MAG TPA: hypothetical protein VFP10_14010 [Candidatus Eisenbacteria bacterium]|nr:hypothetical protein [Candidatus Eisenbacteria bacterium]
MSPALGALLEGIIDYAGLFPPASLNMPAAVAHYRRHLEEDMAVMLATFVCPASQLEALAKAAPGADWKLTILATGEATLASLKQDVAAIEALRQAGQRFEPHALELRFPTSLYRDLSGLAEFAGGVEELVSGLSPRKVFYEIGWMDPWPDVLPILGRVSNRVARGIKIRTGGVTPDAFPSPEQVAAFMVTAVETGVSWKATAGLHHPVRRFDESVGTKMHGFLNLFCGAALAYAGYGKDTLVSILHEEDAAEFKFSGTSFIWRGHALDLELLARTRSEFAFSFGSCSFIEPVEDLRALGYL